MCPFPKANAKVICSALLLCLRPSDKQIQSWVDGARAAFHSTRSLALEHGPAPHLVLAHGLESGLSHVEQAAQQAALLGSSLRVACRRLQLLHCIHVPLLPSPPDRQTDKAFQMVITFIDVRCYTNRSVSISLSTSPRLGEKLEEWGRQGNRTGLSLQDAELSGGEQGQGLQQRRVLLP